MTSEMAESRAGYAVERAETDYLEIKDGMEQIQQRLAALESQVGEVRELLKTVTNMLQGMSEEDRGWLKLAESSFTFWDNEEDAIYDNL